MSEDHRGIFEKMKAHQYEDVVVEAPKVWISDRKADVLFLLVTACYQLKKFNDVCFWAKIFLSSYPGGARYSDVFSFWMESVYRLNGKQKSIPLIKKEVELEILRNGLSYHGLLYKASYLYMSGQPHMADFEAAALMFAKNVANFDYSNNSLRGLQYLVSSNSVEAIDRKENVNKKTKRFEISNVTKRDIWLVSLDTNYFDKYFDYLLKSNNIVRDQYSLHLHVINPNDEQLARIKSLGISFSTEVFSAADPIPYYASSRFLLLSDLMSAYPGANFMITDADVLIHSKIPQSLIVDDYDLAIRMKDPELYPWRDMGAGLCLVKNNKKMNGFFKLFSTLFDHYYDPKKDSFRNTQWWIDQGLLYSLIEHVGEVALKKIDSKTEQRFIFFPQGDKSSSLEKAEKNYLKDA